MIYRYSGSLASECLLIAVMGVVRLVTIGIRTVRLLCLSSCQMLWICVVFSLILIGICFLHGRRIANRLSGVVCCGEIPPITASERLPFVPTLPTPLLSLDEAEFREEEISAVEELPLLSVSDIPLAECQSSLSDFVSSSVVVTITLACGTSVWTIAEPSALRFNEKPFLTNLPSTYQPERECRVMMRLSPTFVKRKCPQPP